MGVGDIFSKLPVAKDTQLAKQEYIVQGLANPGTCAICDKRDDLFMACQMFSCALHRPSTTTFAIKLVSHVYINITPFVIYVVDVVAIMNANASCI